MARLKKCFLIKTTFLILINVVALSQQIIANASPSSGLLDKAREMLIKGQNKEALACLDTLISKEPTNARAYCERARAYYIAEKYDQAFNDSNHAVALDPNLALSYACRAQCHIGKSRYREALTDSAKAIALDSKCALAYRVRIIADEQLEEHQKEIEDCNKAIAIDPKSYQYYLYRATAHRILGQYQRAIQDCDTALNMSDSKEATAFVLRGYAYFYLGKYQNALDDYAAAIKLAPQSYEAFSLRANVYANLGEYQRQIDDMNSAEKIRPRDADLYNRRGAAYSKLGQLQYAIDDARTATRLKPALSNAYITAAKAYEGLGLYEKSVELRTKAFDFKYKNVFNWSDRARDYQLLGKPVLAQTDWQKAKELASPSELVIMQLDNPLIDFNNLSNFVAAEKAKTNIDKQLKSRALVLPFFYDDEHHICVPVQINDRSVNLMLDTGCAYSSLWKQAVPGVARTEKVQVKSIKATRKESFFDFFRAHNLKLGSLILPNVAMRVDEGLIGHKTLSGFLGGNILENFVVTIDYSQKKVILATSFPLNKSGKAIIVPLILSEGRPFCSVKLDGKLSLMALLDTGSPDNLAAESRLRSILEKKLHYKGQVSGPWIGDLSCEKVRLKNLALGTSNFAEPNFCVFPAVEAPEAAREVVLGSNFLSRFSAVTFDYPARRAIFELK